MKKQKTISENPAQQRIADAIVRKTIAVQQRWAGWMQRKTEGLPMEVKKTLFALVFIVAGTYSFYLMITGFTAKNKSAFKVDKIHLPKPINEKKDALPVLSEMEFNKIEAFRFFMDSLNKTITGKRTSDSIKTTRPGLMDSIKQLEIIYRLNKK